MKKLVLVALVLTCCLFFTSGAFAKSVEQGQGKSEIKWLKIKHSNIMEDPVYCSIGYGPDGNKYKLFCYIGNMLEGNRVQFFVNGELSGEVFAPKTKLPKKGSLSAISLTSTVGKTILITEPGYHDLDCKVFYTGGEIDWISYHILIPPFSVQTLDCFQDQDNPDVYIIGYQLDPHFGIEFQSDDFVNIEIAGLGIFESVIAELETDLWHEGLEYYARIEISVAEYEYLLNNRCTSTHFEVNGYEILSATCVRQ